MTIHITKPEVEAIIKQVSKPADSRTPKTLVQALQSSPSTAATPPESDAPPAKDIVELFAPLRGLNLDFRNPSTGRPVDL